MTNASQIRWACFLVATLAGAQALAQLPTSQAARTELAQIASVPGPASSEDLTVKAGLEESEPNSTSAPTEAADKHHRPDVPTGRKTQIHKLDTKYDVAKVGMRRVDRGVNFYSLEKEERLGHELALELEQNVRLVKDPVISDYVNQIGQAIVRNSDAKVPFTIKVIDDDEVNAVALPGGYFYVNTGLIMAADSEAELAGVMAHEVAHVAARHATRTETKAKIWNLASLPLVFVGGPAGLAVRQIMTLGLPVSFLKFSRDAEREADLLGLEYQWAAGYDPLALVQFLEKVHRREKREHSFLVKAFSTHPMTEDRIKRAQDEIGSILRARDQYVLTTSEFDDVKARLAALKGLKVVNGQIPHGPTLRRRETHYGNLESFNPRDDAAETPWDPYPLTARREQQGGGCEK